MGLLESATFQLYLVIYRSFVCLNSVTVMLFFISMCVCIYLDPGAHFSVYLNLEILARCGALALLCSSNVKACC